MTASSHVSIPYTDSASVPRLLLPVELFCALLSSHCNGTLVPAASHSMAHCAFTHRPPGEPVHTVQLTTMKIASGKNICLAFGKVAQERFRFACKSTTAKTKPLLSIYGKSIRPIERLAANHADCAI